MRIGGCCGENNPILLGKDSSVDSALACGRVSIGEMNWDSGEFLARLDGIFLKEAFGCEVQFFSNGTVPHITALVSDGKIDFASELWIEAGKELIEKNLIDKRISVVSEPVSWAGEAWWIDSQTADRFGLRTLTDVLARPDLFPHPSDRTRGGFHTCPVGWKCEIVNNNLFKAFDMREKGWSLVDPGSGAGLDHSIKKSVERGDSWFGYYWAPTATVAKYRLRRLEIEESFDSANWENCVVARTSKKCTKTSFKESEVVTVVRTAFQRREPEVSNYLASRIIPNDVMGQYLALMHDRNLSASEAAKSFVRNESQIWLRWLNQVPANKMATKYNLDIDQPSTFVSSGRSFSQSDLVIFDGVSTRAKHTLIIDPANNEIRFKGSKDVARFQRAFKRAKKNLKIKFGLALHTNQCGDSVRSGTFKSIPVRATTRDGFIVVPLSPFAEYVDFQSDNSLGFVFYPNTKVDEWQCAYFDLNSSWGVDRKKLAAIKHFSDASPLKDPLINEELLGLLESLKNENLGVVDQDRDAPTITIASASSDGPRGIISGIVTDRSGIAEIIVNDTKIVFDADGEFSYATYVPHEGLDVMIRAVDFSGLSTTETIRLERTKRTPKAKRLVAVNPLLGPNQERSQNRVALIIGLEKYAVSQPAEFASRDAEVFADYAREKLGVPASNVKLLTDARASERGILRALKVWLPIVVKPDETDLYVFYAGHGMPTADGSSAYLVPHDGDIQLLEDTAISRTRFFSEIEKARPRSATFFFDNCYSGTTRTEELLLASRPLGIKIRETDVPENYLVFTAGESNQTAGVLDEVKHGRFSYFVFKGLEGEADSNQDGKISAGELHKYVRESVGRFSAGAQTPTMLGDAGRWVLR
jgi:glycine betaine/proline transport system substrate-binding protein